MTMTKRDLVVKIAHQTDLKQSDVMDVLQLTLDMITAELTSGRDVEFRNFGVFELMCRKSRIGRNPNAPENEVKIPSRVVVKFKPGKAMKKNVLKLRPEDLQK